MAKYGFEAYSKFAKAFKKAFGVEATIIRLNVTDDIFDLKAQFKFEEASEEVASVAKADATEWVTTQLATVAKTVNLPVSVGIRTRFVNGYTYGVVYGDCTFSVSSELGV